jgi:RimJ/RimL family protein N-acetyltransferase
MPKIELREWQRADWPLAWAWLRGFWNQVADDFSCQTEADYIKGQLVASHCIHRGVYRDGELGGLLTGVPITPYLVQAHITFKKSFWGRDTTIPALRMGCRVLFDEYHFGKIWTTVFADNHLVIGTLKRLGATWEGTLIAHTVRNGQPIDMQSYCLIQ